MSERQQRLEEGFFGASTDAVAARADAFSDLDPARRTGRLEGRVFGLAVLGGAMLVAVLGWLAPRAGVAPATEKSSAGATSAPVRSPARPAPPVYRPESDRLAALLGVGAPQAPGSAPASVAPASVAPASVATSGALDAGRVTEAAPAGDAGESAVALARKRMESADFAGALAALDAASTHFEARALRGHVLYELGRDQEALEALRLALAERPDHAASLLLLGSLQQAADPEAAGQTYRTFLQAHPNAPQAAEVRQILERI